MHGQVAETRWRPLPLPLAKEPRGLRGWGGGVQLLRPLCPVALVSNSSLPCLETASWRSGRVKAAPQQKVRSDACGNTHHPSKSKKRLPLGQGRPWARPSFSPIRPAGHSPGV